RGRAAEAGAARRACRGPARRGDRAPGGGDPPDPRADRGADHPRRPRHEPGVGLLRDDRGARLRQAYRVRPDRRGAPRRARDQRLPRNRGGRDLMTETAARERDNTGMLALRGLTVERGSRAVVRDVSIEIPAGEITALLGPNGAGKSSLVLAVGGVLRLQAGSVLLDGLDWANRRPERIRRAGIAVVPEG